MIRVVGSVVVMAYTSPLRVASLITVLMKAVLFEVPYLKTPMQLEVTMHTVQDDSCVNSETQLKVASAWLAATILELEIHMQRGKILMPSTRTVKPVPLKKELERVRNATEQRCRELNRGKV